jgi:hypothetical protein
MSQALEICEEWKEPNLYKEGKMTSSFVIFFCLTPLFCLVSLTILDVLDDFMEDFRAEILRTNTGTAEENSDLLDEIYKVFVSEERNREARRLKRSERERREEEKREARRDKREKGRRR